MIKWISILRSPQSIVNRQLLTTTMIDYLRLSEPACLDGVQCATLTLKFMPRL
jgi:hypothetical protein